MGGRGGGDCIGVGEGASQCETEAAPQRVLLPPTALWPPAPHCAVSGKHSLSKHSPASWEIRGAARMLRHLAGLAVGKGVERKKATAGGTRTPDYF